MEHFHSIICIVSLSFRVMFFVCFFSVVPHPCNLRHFCYTILVFVNVYMLTDSSPHKVPVLPIYQSGLAQVILPKKI